MSKQVVERTVGVALATALGLWLVMPVVHPSLLETERQSCEGPHRERITLYDGDGGATVAWSTVTYHLLGGAERQIFQSGEGSLIDSIACLPDEIVLKGEDREYRWTYAAVTGELADKPVLHWGPGERDDEVIQPMRVLQIILGAGILLRVLVVLRRPWPPTDS